MKKQKVAFLIIDMQKDFCKPKGALFVPGAVEDVGNTVKFLRNNLNKIDQVILTQDNHQVMDISHPSFWVNENGENPSPFTQISFSDIGSGKWKALYKPDFAHEYIQKLEQQGEFPHVIWPEHCIIGSKGAAIDSQLMEICKTWARQGHFIELVIKGTNPLTEHFGAVRANIPLNDYPETQTNNRLIELLNGFDLIFVAGEAKSHCVANTLKQLFDYPEICKKITIFTDCMSDVPGFEKIALSIYDKALEIGMKMTKSTSVKL